MREREKRKMREKRWKSRSVSMATDPFSQLTVDKSIGAMLGPGTLRRGLIEAGLPLLFLFFPEGAGKSEERGKTASLPNRLFLLLAFSHFLLARPVFDISHNESVRLFREKAMTIPWINYYRGRDFWTILWRIFFAPPPPPPQLLPFCSFLLGLEAGILFSGKEFSISEFKRSRQVLFLSIF